MGVPPPPPPPDDGGGFTAPPLWQRGLRVELRQRTLSDFMDAAYNLYRLHWRSLIGIVALVVVPLQFAEQYLERNYRHVVFFQRHVSRAQSSRLAVLTWVFLGIGLLVVRPLLAGAITRAVAGFHLGEEPTAGRVLDFGIATLGPLFVVVLLATVATFVGLLLLVIPGIYVAVRLSVAPQALVVEGASGADALSRSWELTRGHFWRLFGITLVVGIVTAFVAILVQIPFLIGAANAGAGRWILVASGASVGAVLVRPFALIVQVLLYLDLRVRKDGFTLERLSAELRRRP